MRNILLVFYTITLFIFIPFNNAGSQQPVLNGKGSLGFWFFISEAYHNGLTPKGSPVTLLEVSDIFCITLEAHSSMVTLEFVWNIPGVDRLALNVPHLPGPAWYYLAYCWDQERGLFDGYLNGIPLRVPGTKVQSWTFQKQSVEFQRGDNVQDLEISTDIWTDEIIRDRTKRRSHIDVSSLIGFNTKTFMKDVETLKGTLLYLSLIHI